MSFESLLIEEDVTVRNPATAVPITRYGDPTETWSTVETKARIDLLTAEENLQYRDTRITRYRAFFKPDVAITALSEVDWNGRRHRLAGRPDVLKDSSGDHHIEAILELIEG